ncbi:hypothetical protein [Nannocystis pusilla]|uniref:Uncharacterized protein n=1 Tax=Nannocystis pusilla TaxID=889268 RepID=A0ABS7TJ79_9BACT|nr:hypothetical protein [Nannocystis pusilla]MBZ5708166.1 hypothetical protein [Nannocystis pusilla]
MQIARPAVAVMFAALASGCGPVSNESTTTATTTATTTSSTPSSSTTELAPTSTTTTSTTTTSSTSTSSTTSAPTSSDSGNFVVMPDLPTPGAACDPWQDTCPEGQKCKPYSEGFGPWVGASCVPVADPAVPIGEPCEAQELSIIDECERGAVCHGFLTAEGLRCHEICSGSLMEPSCSDECSHCVSNGGFAGVCLFPCDPRASDCPQGQSCQIQVDWPRFVCGLGPGPGAAGEACTSPGGCSAGTACAAAALVPGCTDARCCAPVCDLDGPDTCPAALPGTACGPWPESGPEFQGACLPAGLGLCTAA